MFYSVAHAERSTHSKMLSITCFTSYASTKPVFVAEASSIFVIWAVKCKVFSPVFLSFTSILWVVSAEIYFLASVGWALSS